jgi:hypothetical protein
MARDKILQAVLSGKHDNNIRFDDLCNVLLQSGFKERTKGGHYIYKREGIAERINLQPIGNMAKSYQVRQVRTILNKYSLGG